MVYFALNLSNYIILYYYNVFLDPNTIIHFVVKMVHLVREYYPSFLLLSYKKGDWRTGLFRYFTDLDVLHISEFVTITLSPIQSLSTSLFTFIFKNKKGLNSIDLCFHQNLCIYFSHYQSQNWTRPPKIY